MGFPRFEDYLPGTILEVILSNYKSESFLIMILDEKHHKTHVAVYLNGRYEVGQLIHINHSFKITHQVVKKGGLRDEYKT